MVSRIVSGTAAVLVACGLSGCGTMMMAHNLDGACVAEFDKDGNVKRVEPKVDVPQTLKVMGREIEVRRVTGSRLPIRVKVASPEPACNASGAPNIG